MKKLLIVVCVIALFTNCNNSAGSGGWSSQDRQKGLKACMDGINEKLDEATAKKFCNCALQKAMQKWNSYAESEEAPDEAGTEIGQSCLAAIQGGGGDEPGDEPKGKGGGLFGGGGKWSKSDKNTFSTQCQQGMVAGGHDESKARELCDCILQKLQKKYSSLQEANEKGGETAGAKARQECEGGGMDDNDENGSNDENENN